jgi:hypothetical protein
VNDQNPDWGIETSSLLLLRIPDPGVNDQNPDWGIETFRDDRGAVLEAGGVNDQNPDWGIETGVVDPSQIMELVV